MNVALHLARRTWPFSPGAAAQTRVPVRTVLCSPVYPTWMRAAPKIKVQKTRVRKTGGVLGGADVFGVGALSEAEVGDGRRTSGASETRTLTDRHVRKQTRSPTETCPGTMTILRSPRRTRSGRSRGGGRSPQHRTAARLRPPPAAARSGARVQLIGAQRHRGLPDTRSPGHQSDSAMPQRTGLGPSAAAAAVHPDAGRSSRTSPPESRWLPPCCLYHTSMQNSRKLRLFSGKALSGIGPGGFIYA